LCGRVPIVKDGFISLYSHPENPVISGLMRCSSPTACVVCSTRIAIERGQWLSQVFSVAKSRGYSISMLTLTVRHKKSNDLPTLLDSMEQAYTNIQGSSSFKILRKDFDASFIRVTEITHGKNGWHPHYHLAIIHRSGFDFSAFTQDMQRTWCKHIQRQGLLAPIPEKAVDVVIDASDEQRAWYLTKASGMSSLEVTNGKNKVAKGDNLGIWQIHGLAVNGDKSCTNLWHLYEKAIFKRRIFTMSKGMADKFAVSLRLDQEIAMDEFKDVPDSADNLHNEVVEPTRIKFEGVITTKTWIKINKKQLNLELYNELKKPIPNVQDFLDRNELNALLYKPDEIKERHENKQFLTKLLSKAYETSDPTIFEVYSRALYLADLYQEAIDAENRF